MDRLFLLAPEIFFFFYKNRHCAFADIKLRTNAKPGHQNRTKRLFIFSRLYFSNIFPVSRCTVTVFRKTVVNGRANVSKFDIWIIVKTPVRLRRARKLKTRRNDIRRLRMFGKLLNSRKRCLWY